MDKREFAALAAAMEEYYGRNQITKSAASMDIWYDWIGISLWAVQERSKAADGYK